MAKWDPFGSPGSGDQAKDKLAVAEMEAGYGTPAEQRSQRKRKKKRKRKRAAQQQAEDAAAAALLLQDVPFYQDSRFIGGGLILTAIVGGVYFSKKNKK